jgi:hypothetical protein
MKLGFVASAASALTLALCAAAQANTVIGPADYSGSSYYIYAGGDGYSTTPTGPGTIAKSASSLTAQPGTAAATLGINATPFPSISAHSATTGIGQAAISGQMTYQFRIEDASGIYDPSHPINVPTLFNYKGTASAPSQGGATAYFNIAGDNFAESYQVTAGAFPSATHILATCCGGVLDPTFTGPTFDEHKLYSIVADKYYRIDLKATAVVSGDGVSDAFIDPYFFIDPTFADKGNFHIVLSQGISNIAPTPIPPSLLLFGTAILGLGGLGYRAKRNGLAAA